jgi:hypothetical protein
LRLPAAGNLKKLEKAVAVLLTPESIVSAFNSSVFGTLKPAGQMSLTPCYGDLYQWGRAKDGHESRTSGTTTTRASSITTPASNDFILNNSGDWVSGTTVSNSKLTAVWRDGGVNDICPAGFSVPNTDELKADTVKRLGFL